jgi:hypothetical protein
MTLIHDNMTPADVAQARQHITERYDPMSKHPTRQQEAARDEANRSARHWGTRAAQARSGGREADAKTFDRGADRNAAKAVAAQRAIDRDPSRR